MPAHEIPRLHFFLARRLNLYNFQATLTSSHHQSMLGGSHYLTRPAAGAQIRQSGFPDFKILIIHYAPGTWPGIEPSDKVMYFLCWLSPVNMTSILGEHAGIAAVLIYLLLTLYCTCFYLLHCFLQQLSTLQHKNVVELLCSHVICNINMTLQKHVTSIKTLIHIHCGVTGFSFTVNNRPMYWRCATITRQQ